MTDFTEKLQKWYAANGRDLPWRKTHDPYKIWLSEIILQQTRIEQGTAYYHAFVNKYPTVADLAAAPEVQVLKLWQGLGYYSRARNMHKAANQIVELYGGKFPAHYSRLLQLKGVGPYTAAAVASIAFNEAVALIDGNVARVLSRVNGIRYPLQSARGKRIFENTAAEVLDVNNPSVHNQALMDFGSVFCVPRKPPCTICIFKQRCYAFQNEMTEQLPVKNKKVAVRKRYFNYFVLVKPIAGGKIIYLKRRTEDDIWKNLYDFPLLETLNNCSRIAALKVGREKFGNIKFLWRSKPYKHQLTHRQIIARFYVFTVGCDFKAEDGLIPAGEEQIENFPVPRLLEKFMTDEKFL